MSITIVLYRFYFNFYGVCVYHALEENIRSVIYPSLAVTLGIYVGSGDTTSNLQAYTTNI